MNHTKLVWCWLYLGDRKFQSLAKTVSSQHRTLMANSLEMPSMDPVAKKSMLREDLEYACNYCARLDSLISYMDRALLTLDWACLGRISEVADLEVTGNLYL